MIGIYCLGSLRFLIANNNLSETEKLNVFLFTRLVYWQLLESEKYVIIIFSNNVQHTSTLIYIKLQRQILM